MEMNADAHISFSRDLAFRAYRDHLPELVPFLPNVKKIDVKSTDDDGHGVVKKLNVWFAKGDVPGPVQAIIKPEMLSWDDHATWNQNTWTCDWRVDTHFFKDRVSCHGRNTFIDEGERTLFQLRGTLDIDLKGLPGVPKLFAGKVGGLIEKFIVALMTPNLRDVSRGVDDYLRSTGGVLKS